MILVEKYRPQKVEDIVGLDISGFAVDQNLPHLLLYGPPGTGKTTLAKAIIRSLGCDSITLNASDERGIETVREKVKNFASTQGVNPGIKIIFLDEADALTIDAQNALRNPMETYSKNCKFIITANNVNKIIEPIQSRCVRIEFSKIPKELIAARLKFICDSEKIPYDVEALNIIAENCAPDIRRSVNKLEELRSGVTIDKLQFDSGIADEVFKNLIIGDFMAARQLYLDAHVEIEQFLKDLFNVIIKSKVNDNVKEEAVFAIADCFKSLGSSAWKEIQVENALLLIKRAANPS
jgi:replication factor C small subunit